MALACRLNSQTGQLNPCQLKLEQDTGLKKRVITEAIKALESSGLVRVIRSGGRGHNNNYQLISKERVHGDAPFNEERVHESVIKGARERKERVHHGAPRTQEVNTGRNRGEKAPAAGANSLKPKTVVDLYHEFLPMCPAVRKLTKARETQIKARLAQDLKTEEAWTGFFQYVAASHFLTGQSETNNGRKPFFADLEWLTKESNFVKVIEGKYE
jgi:hypothetical protein